MPRKDQPATRINSSREVLLTSLIEHVNKEDKTIKTLLYAYLETLPPSYRKIKGGVFNALA